MPPLETQDAAFDRAGEGSPPRSVDVERYEVVGELGQGGLGTVLRARDKRLDRWVALKLLRRLSAEHEQRFFEEAALTARLEHPAIVPVHDVGRWLTGEPFYAMKLVEGQSLRELAQKCLTLEARLPLVVNVLTVCDAIGYAHARGVIHRDLKPSNVMVGDYGETLVIDWGLARRLDAIEAPTLSGTPHYMAPEQARGEAIDARCDVYALGAMLYEVIGGQAPYERFPSREVLAEVSVRAPAPLLKAAPEAPRELVAIVEKAMSRDAAQRYPDGHAMAVDLRRYLEGKLVGAYRYSAWQRLQRAASRNRPATAAVLLGIFALGTLGTVSLQRIVEERDAARVARGLAEASMRTAEGRRDALMLSQAKLWLDTDPTTAFAWARAFAATASARPDSVSVIAANAVARGVATQLTRGRKRVTLSPDGRWLAGLEGDRLVLWSLTEATVKVLGTVGSPLSVLRFAPDGRALFVAEGKVLRRWALEAGEPTVLFTAPQDLTALALAGELVVLGGEEGGVWLSHDAGAHFEARTTLGSRVNWVELSAGRARAVASDLDGAFEVLGLEAGAPLFRGTSQGGARLAADGSRLGWSAPDGELWIYEVARGAARSLGRRHGGAINAVAISADGRWLASFGQDHLVLVDDTLGAERLELKGHEGWVLNGAFSPDGTQLLSVSGDRTARLWHLATGDVEVLKGHRAPFRLFTFTPQSQQVITGDAEGEVRVWPGLRPRAQVFPGHTGEYVVARFLPDGALVSSAEDGQLRWWSLSGGAHRQFTEPGPGGAVNVSEKWGLLINGGTAGVWTRELAHPERAPVMLQSSEVHDVALSADGSLLASAGVDHVVRLFTLPGGAERRLGVHTSAAWHVAFSPDGRWVASGGDDLPIRVWPLGAGEPVVLPGPEGVTYDLRFSPDGRWLAAAGVDAVLHVWDSASWSRRTFKGHLGLIRQLAFSPDSSRVATASDDHSVRVWSLAGDRAAQLLPHALMTYAVAFSGDGTQVVTGSDDGLVRLWNASNGELQAVGSGHRGPVVSLVVSPDGQSLASTSEDHTVRYWPGFFQPGPVPGTSAALAGVSSVVLRDDLALSPSEASP